MERITGRCQEDFERMRTRLKTLSGLCSSQLADAQLRYDNLVERYNNVAVRQQYEFALKGVPAEARLQTPARTKS